MTKKDLVNCLEALSEEFDGIRDDLKELIDKGTEDEDVRFTSAARSVFVMPLADVSKMLHAGLSDLIRIGDQIVTDHDKFGPVVFDVIGKNHDHDPYDPEKPTLTLQMHYVLPGTYVYDTESRKYPYGHAYYPASTIRDTLNDEILNGFSVEDQEAMLNVEKVTYSSDSDGGSPVVTNDKLFLLSASEVGFTGETVRPEGEAYEYYDGLPMHRCKDELNKPATARHWWLRSPYPGHAHIARHVNTSGARNLNLAYHGIGAAAACVIG